MLILNVFVFILAVSQHVWHVNGIHSTEDLAALGDNSTSLNQWEATIRTCNDSKRAGQFVMQLNDVFPPFKVLCHHGRVDANDKWLVIQQRVDGSVNFFRNWVDYREGFGNLDGEFWLGLEKIHQITRMVTHELLVEMVNFNGAYRFARYNTFRVESELNRYALALGSFNSGTAGDSLVFHHSLPFSTYDSDNDLHESVNCPIMYHGAWWYRDCVTGSNTFGANLNGKYEESSSRQRIQWTRWTDAQISYTRMMVRLAD